MPDITPPILSARFYPTLSSIVSIDDIPEVLGFIKDGIESKLEQLHFKDLQYNKSPRGDAAFYSLSIVAKNRVDIEILGTGISLVLNADLGSSTDFNVSVFPVTMEYEWKILAYLREFNLNNFEFSPIEIFQTALRILNITEEQALSNFINVFVETVDGVTAIDQFVIDIQAEEPSIDTIDFENSEDSQLTKVIDEDTLMYLDF